MTRRERAPLDFGDELDNFDPAAWPAQPAAEKAPRADTRQVAEAAGFRSREPGTTPAQQRRRRTGRNAQFNLKAKPETIALFCQIADEQGWGLGEAFEHATALLAQAARKPIPPLGS